MMGAATAQLHSITLTSMAMPFTLKWAGPTEDDSRVNNAIQATQRWLDTVDRDFSPFRADSLVSRMRRDELMTADMTEDFVTVYGLAMSAQSGTDGAFDPFFDGGYNPTGLVKGWAIECTVTDYWQPLISRGVIMAAAVNGAGDMQMAVADDSDFTWHVGIESPFVHNQLIHQYSLQNGAVATSGISQRGEHIVGRAAEDALVQATVIATSLTTADIWATSALVLGRTRFLTRVADDPLGGLVIGPDGNVTEF